MRVLSNSGCCMHLYMNRLLSMRVLITSCCCMRLLINSRCLQALLTMRLFIHRCCCMRSSLPSASVRLATALSWWTRAGCWLARFATPYRCPTWPKSYAFRFWFERKWCFHLNENGVSFERKMVFLVERKWLFYLNENGCFHWFLFWLKMAVFLV